MGAIFAVMGCLLETGDHVVAQRNHYAGATTLMKEFLPRWGVEITYVDQTDNAEFAAAVRPNTKLIYVETPVNPLMQITDLRFVVELAKDRGVVTICDNTFATPVNQRPLEFGVDAVVHSATKYVGGHHDVTAGALIGSKISSTASGVSPWLRAPRSARSTAGCCCAGCGRWGFESNATTGTEWRWPGFWNIIRKSRESITPASVSHPQHRTWPDRR